MFEKNKSTIALNILYIKEKENCPAYISKINSNCEKNNSINDSKRRKSRMALSCSKKLPALLRGITIKHHGDFNCLNCRLFFRTENFKSHGSMYK